LIGAQPPIATEQRNFGTIRPHADIVAIRYLSVFIIIAAISFNFILCFLNTNLGPVSSLHVIGSELLIISAAFLCSIQVMALKHFVLIGGTFLYLLTLALIRAAGAPDGAFDVKIIRDFMIPIAFFLLGARVQDTKTADLVVTFIAVIVTAIALLEYFFLDAYLRYFNVIGYYVARGTVETIQTEFLSTNLFVSGIRPEGRSLFPFLGDHRVSSLFLEPVSPGNFGVIVFFWALVRSQFEKRLYSSLFVMALFLIVMADNRFGAALCISALAMNFLLMRYSYYLVLGLPLIYVCGLLGVLFVFADVTPDNSFLGRIIASAQTFSSLDIWNLMGIQDTASWVGDSGYTYLFTKIGLLGFAAFWLIFMTLPGAKTQFSAFRGFAGLYIATSLCVSTSPFSIKTAALLWLLLGVLAYAPETEHELARQRS
jgi:putative polymerase